MYDDLLEVVILLFPLQKGLRLLVVAEVLEEDEHGQVLEVGLLKEWEKKAKVQLSIQVGDKYALTSNYCWLS